MRQHLYITSHILRYPFSSTGSKFLSQEIKEDWPRKLGLYWLIEPTKFQSLSLPNALTNFRSQSESVYTYHTHQLPDGMVHHNFSQATSIAVTGRPSSYTFSGRWTCREQARYCSSPPKQIMSNLTFFTGRENSI